MKYSSESNPSTISHPYVVEVEPEKYTLSQPVSTDEMYELLLGVIEQRFYRGDRLSSPSDTRIFFQLKLARLEHEVFSVVFLDSQHRVLAYEEMFRGTIDSASVYPREVVKQALKYNAAAVIFAHCHPSGIPEPSQADRKITDKLVQALDLVGVRVLDHMIVAGIDCVSMAERGLV